MRGHSQSKQICVELLRQAPCSQSKQTYTRERGISKQVSAKKVTAKTLLLAFCALNQNKRAKINAILQILLKSPSIFDMQSACFLWMVIKMYLQGKLGNGSVMWMQEREKHIIRPKVIRRFKGYCSRHKFPKTYPKIRRITSDSIRSRPISLARSVASLHSCKFNGCPPLSST